MKASKIEKFLTKLAEGDEVSKKKAGKRLNSLRDIYADLTVKDQRLKVQASGTEDADAQAALQEKIKNVDSQRRRSLRYMRKMIEQLEA